MQNFFTDLYDGEIRPCEGKFPKTQKYKEKLENFRRIENDLLSRLNEEEQEIYQQLGVAILERNRIEDILAFSDAFRLGVNMMLACLWESEDN